VMPSAVHIIIIIIIILFITFMQGIYNYIPAANHFSRVYSVAAVLYLQFVYMRICLLAHLIVSQAVLGFVAVWNIPSLVKFIIF